MRALSAACAALLAAAPAAAVLPTFTPGTPGQLTVGGAGVQLLTAAAHPLTRPGIDDIVVGLGVFPPTPNIAVPIKILAPQSDGTMTDITATRIVGAIPAMTHPRQIVFGDVNGDGKADIFIAAHGYDQAPYTGERNALLLSRGDGNYDPSTALPTPPDFSHSATLADFNSDGRTDIYVGNIYGENGVAPYVLTAAGGGGFTLTRKLPTPVAPLSGPTFTTSLALDVDNDGYPDLILGSGDATASPSLVLFNDGSGDFTKRAKGTLPPGLFGTNTINLHIATIDINGDGYADLLISQTRNSPFYIGGAVQVLVNDHNGGFADQTATWLGTTANPNGPWYQFIRVADLNADGVPDIYITGIFGTFTNPITIGWVSDGSGHYVPIDSSLTQNNAYMLVGADIDGDGRLDLVSLYNDNAGVLHYQVFVNATPRSSPRPYSLVVTKAGAGRGTVRSTAVGIDCGAKCDSSAPLGAPVTLTAAPQAGSVFAGWSGACTGTAACNVTMAGATAVTATFAPEASRLFNISTRMQVLTGNDVMIAGFIVGGTSAKTVVVNVAGPSLANFGITNALQNPTLTLVRSSDSSVVASNDDWQTQGNPPDVAAIQASGFQPNSALEPAVIATLVPGAYTAIVQGAAAGTGVGLVGVFEVNQPDSALTNISTRGQVLTGNDVMIAGFIVQGTDNQTVVLNVAGPSLANFGISNPLSNPTLTLVRSADNFVIASNDDWRTQAIPAHAVLIQAAGFQPNHALEPAIFATLAPGAYTAIVSGVGGATGVGLVGVFRVQ